MNQTAYIPQKAVKHFSFEMSTAYIPQGCKTLFIWNVHQFIVNLWPSVIVHLHKLDVNNILYLNASKQIKYFCSVLFSLA